MTTTEHAKSQVRHAADGARRQMGDRHQFMKLQHSHDQLLALLHEQQHEVQLLRRDLKRRKSGGFPWGLVLLLGGGYALYRSSPAVRDRVQSLLGAADPSLQGTMNRARTAGKDSVSDMRQGHNPVDAFQRAAGETQRAGDKAVNGARDAVQDVKAGAHPAADGATSSGAKGIT